MSEMKTHSVIVLIGMPGAGKSTVGALLAQRLGCDCIDTDRLIEANGQAMLAELLARHGRDGFSELEAAALREAWALAVAAGTAVISTGGSAVYCAAEMAQFRARAWVVYLEVELATLMARAGDLYARGVVRRPGQSLADLYDERAALYARYAHRRYACGTLPAAAVCDLITAGG
jgi:shikimate kinase